ncbi:MAG TPA: hypothetical protein VH394_06285 [Thermoanaerobaculia bacterium]|jgi:hypothetical protein|nr:hypothetical protein [Thermoanaerobaculia bacterium]
MRHPVSRGFLAAAVLSLLSLIPDSASAAKSLTLRVNDARGGPGDLVAVVVRTYASRPIGQGQLCIGARKRPPRGASTALLATEAPFVKLERAEVFSARGDARFSVTFDEQEATLRFNSPTGSINAADGPLAVLYFRLSNQVVDRDVYEISVDVAESTLFDGSGQRIEIDSKPGQLEIRDGDHEAEDLEVEVSSGKVKAGKVARVMIGTGSPVRLASGRIALRYDPKLISGRPWVRIDPRYGKATVVVSTDTAGLVTITFQSPDKSLNGVPGDLFEVRFPTSRQAPRGRTALTLDRSLTFLRGSDGDLLDLQLTNGALVVR